jgi:hypothetical protein
VSGRAFDVMLHCAKLRESRRARHIFINRIATTKLTPRQKRGLLGEQGEPPYIAERTGFSGRFRA